MAKINLYKVLRDLETDRDFKERLRTAFQSVAPDLQLTRDQVHEALTKALYYYKDHTIAVPDEYIEIKER
ncbi:hypothetical protein C4585_03350 [Candidatus Parcubacteria bacterium]|nr:MAG: hypothetical protein C4585_03350 [Candidatus Parcubacteria bacterium]